MAKKKSQKETKKSYFLNEKIPFTEVLVIDENNQMLGSMSKKAAIEVAFNKNLDLLFVSKTQDGAVCKILDFGKWNYKKQKQTKKVAQTKSKEIRVRINISDHDLQVKANNAIRFFKHKDKVHLKIRFRGRQILHKDLGYEIVDKFYEMIKEYAEYETKPALTNTLLDVLFKPINK
ncbi:translation initiation factor IF-3 [symbiont of Argiope bruennichi]|uniref:translation initiation factor IF-3 n=1 Tax=symbiont of Argiope bruennichi TaxID=2810479 RepID=UPI003DA33914